MTQAIIPVGDGTPLPLAPATLDPAILAGQLAPSSIRMYRRDWAAYTAWCASAQVEPLAAASLARWRTHLASETTNAASTINRMLAACKRLLKEAAAQGYVPSTLAEDFAHVDGVKPAALKTRVRPHARTKISPAQMRKLCNAPDRTTLKGKRDAGLLATAASSGVRVSELASLQVGSLVERDGGYFISVLGKNQTTPREAPLSEEAYLLIQEWIATRPVASLYLFTRWGGRGQRLQATPISTVAAWQIVQEYATACDLAHIKPHDLRRFVGTQLARKNPRVAQKVLGHKRIDTTMQHYVLDELEPHLTDHLY